MKPATTLKELLKPPFEADRSQFGYIYVVDSEIIDAGSADCFINSILSKKRRLLQPFIYLDRNNYGGEVADFAAAAMNEKWERDFGNSRTCHYCYNKKDYQLYYRGQEMDIVYCPFCGRLILSEEISK
jgi:hypothetical protein